MTPRAGSDPTRSAGGSSDGPGSNRRGPGSRGPGPPRPLLPPEVVIREVGPRDGLQSEAPAAPAARARLVNALVAAGCRRVEAVSFVSERAVPAMAGAAEVLNLVERVPGCSIIALVPNLRGAELALGAGVDELTVTVAASPAYNERNVRRTIDESVVEIGRVAASAATDGIGVDAVVSCAFGSPYEGDIDPRLVAALCARLLDQGASAITLADTTGMATPRVLTDVLDETGTGVGLHLHETRGTGLLNAYAALQAGATRFDTSIGGLGGSPFADGAAGNLATEDLVALLDDFGIQSGIALDLLLETGRLAAEIVGHELPSRIAAAGPRSRTSSAHST